MSRTLASEFKGSMLGAGAAVFAVWLYALFNCDRSGEVALHPKLLAAVIGCQEDQIEAALKWLLEQSQCRMTPTPRLKQAGGGYVYVVVEHQRYRDEFSRERRSESNRVYQSRHRAKKAVDDICLEKNMNDVTVSSMEAEQYPHP